MRDLREIGKSLWGLHMLKSVQKLHGYVLKGGFSEGKPYRRDVVLHAIVAIMLMSFCCSMRYCESSVLGVF